jgi:hypothetical protein
MTLPQDVIGVDVSKDWIDVFTLSTAGHGGVNPALRRLMPGGGPLEHVRHI